jgi:hypothetical protein
MSSVASWRKGRTVVADEQHAGRQLAQQLLVEEARDLNAIERAEDDEDAVEGAAAALGEEVGAALGRRLQQLG